MVCEDALANAAIQLYGISVAVANVPKGRIATLDDVELGFVSNFANGNFFPSID